MKHSSFEGGGQPTGEAGEGQGVEVAEGSGLEQRLAAAKGGRLRVVKENPGPGQLTPEELGSFDPQRGEGDYASAAVITAMIYEGQHTPDAFVKELTEGRKSSLPRCQATFDNMVKAGLLQVRDGKVYLNTDLR